MACTTRTHVGPMEAKRLHQPGCRVIGACVILCCVKLGCVGTMDGILDTISADHQLMSLIAILKTRGKCIALSGMTRPAEIAMHLPFDGAKTVVGSLIGGIKGTQEMLYFAEEHNVTADVEVVGMDDANVAMERLQEGDVRYRFVIDVANTIALSK